MLSILQNTLMTPVYAYSAVCTIKGNKDYYALTHVHNLPWTFIFMVVYLLDTKIEEMKIKTDCVLIHYVSCNNLETRFKLHIIHNLWTFEFQKRSMYMYNSKIITTFSKYFYQNVHDPDESLKSFF